MPRSIRITAPAACDYLEHEPDVSLAEAFVRLERLAPRGTYLPKQGAEGLLQWKLPGQGLVLVVDATNLDAVALVTSPLDPQADRARFVALRQRRRDVPPRGFGKGEREGFYQARCAQLEGRLEAAEALLADALPYLQTGHSAAQGQRILTWLNGSR